MRKIEFQSSQRICLKPEHQNRQIQILCLEDSCKEDRLLCLLCLGQSHRLHNTAILSPEILTPLQVLKLHSENSNSTKYAQILVQKFQSISNEWVEMQSLVKNSVCQMDKELRVQFQSICRTFDKNTFDTALQALRNPSVGVDQIQNYVVMINFLEKINFQNPQSVIKIADYIQHHLEQEMQSAKKQIQNILHDLSEKLKKYNFLNQKIEEDMQAEQEQQNKMKDQKASSTAKGIIEEEQKEGGCFLKLGDECTISKVRKEQKERNMQEQQNVQVIELDQDLILPRSKYVFQINSLSELLKQLQSIPQRHLRELTICSDNKPLAINNQILQIILKSKKLKKLQITWCHFLTKKQILSIISSLPKLQQLTLSCCVNFDRDCVDSIINNLPNIKKLHYGYNYHTYNAMINEDSQFFHMERYFSLSIQQCFSLSKLKNLETMWITQCDSKLSISSISNMKNLKELCLGAMVTSKQFKTLKEPLCRTISEQCNLRSLSLTCLSIKEENLILVLEGNPNIQTIILQQCIGITDLTIQALSTSCRITKMNLFFFDSLTGKYLQNFTQIQQLVLSACWGIDKKIFANTLLGYKHLQLLNISYNTNQDNKWADDTLMQSISQCKKLKHLNIQSTQISSKGLIALGEMKQLTTLLCGSSKVCGYGLRAFCTKNNQVQKLGLAGLNATNNCGIISSQDFESIQNTLTRLTHLNICQCNHLDLKFLLGFAYLECLSVSFGHATKQTKRQMEERGVFIFQQKV